MANDNELYIVMPRKCGRTAAYLSAEAAKEELRIQSTSKMMFEVGKYAAKGFDEGMRNVHQDDLGDLYEKICAEFHVPKSVLEYFGTDDAETMATYEAMNEKEENMNENERYEKAVAMLERISVCIHANVYTKIFKSTGRIAYAFVEPESGYSYRGITDLSYLLDNPFAFFLLRCAISEALKHKQMAMQKIFNPYPKATFFMPEIEKVIFNDPATIVFWKDGTKTVVKAQNEAYDPEKGLAMAISKKALGNKRDYYIPFKKLLKKFKPKETNK